MKSEPQMESNHIRIINSRTHYIIKVTLGVKTINKYLQIQQKLRSLTKQAKLFENFENRGNCEQITFNFDKQENVIKVRIQKNYFYYVLNQREYELLIISKHMLHSWDQFLQHITNFAKYIQENQTAIKLNEVVQIDLISITIRKTFEMKKSDGSVVNRTIYLRQSSFEFKKNLSYYRSKQSDHLFSFVEFESQGKLPSPEFFYSKPRLNFIDDLHSSQSLLKRFTQRFLTFYIPFCLSTGQVDPYTPEIRQFYRKVYPSSYFYAVRLKKFGFIFPVQRVLKQNNKVKVKDVKISIYFYCHEKENEKTINTVTDIKNNENFYYYVETILPDKLSQRLVNEAFTNRLLLMSDKFYPQIQKERGKLNLQPRNQDSYCKILCQFSFLLDRIFLLMLDHNRSLKNKLVQDLKEYFHKNALEDDILSLKLPKTEMYIAVRAKYNHSYQLQIRSRRMNAYNETQDQKKDYYPYQNELSEIKILRKKKTQQNEPQPDHLFFAQRKGGNFQKGIKQYINKIFSCWNLRDIFQEVSHFTGSLMEIILDKHSDKVQLKNYGKWNSIIGALDILLLSLSQLFFTNVSAIKLSVISEQVLESVFNNEKQDDSIVVLQLTFAYYELKRGWRQVIAPCIYLFRFSKNFISFLKEDTDEETRLQIDGGKNSYKKKIRQFMLETNQEQLIYPFV